MWYTPLALVSGHLPHCDPLLSIGLQESLESEFVEIPTAHILQTFKECNALYAPTYLVLRSNARPYRTMSRPRHG